MGSRARRWRFDVEQASHDRGLVPKRPFFYLSDLMNWITQTRQPRGVRERLAQVVRGPDPHHGNTLVLRRREVRGALVAHTYLCTSSAFSVE